MRNLIFFSLLVASQAFSATVIPFERDEPRYINMDYITSNNADSLFFTTNFAGFNNGVELYRGFGVSNIGPNDIVTSEPTGFDFPSRDFEFITEDRSRQETYLWVTDYNGSGRVSDRYETIFMFFPRENQPFIEEMEEVLLITLPTGEPIAVDKKYKTITGGEMVEGPLDYKGNFALLKYNGKGFVLRLDAKGADPRNVRMLRVQKNGLPDCQIETAKLWNQGSFPRFKYPRDEDVYKIVLDQCGEKYLP